MLEEQRATQESPDSPTATSSVAEGCQSLHQQIDSTRVRLEGIFRRLHLILDVCITVHKALIKQHAEQDETFANVLQHCGFDKLHEQLERLAAIVEELGGTCEFTGERPTVGKKGPLR